MTGTITRSTLRQQVADALREEVLAGRLSAGTGFTVKEIAQQYGVSATPVREALLDLTAQGLLDADQHRGFRVHRFGDADYDQMVRARSIIVEGVFAQLERSRTMRDFRCTEAIRRRAEASRRAALAGELDVLIGYDLRFWRELAEIIGNPYVADVLERVRIHSWVYAVPRLRAQADLRGLLWAGHLDLFDAVHERDLDRARRVLGEYHAHCLALLNGLPARPA
ncbi:GntR family transcriptional regulator [Streptomyces sp. P38-E01]|uniref:GntR family transcriptional regulator n=1 Tax=Streptomyces tardus TaxID=2780544 RepID=A0A949JCT5_9ACTN|nr:GntR family transcriptional regulator [Streptomyces tardus]MBU7597491.1 GntR family transcriptional regulator [Streptomyces tardus]